MASRLGYKSEDEFEQRDDHDQANQKNDANGAAKKLQHEIAHSKGSVSF